VFGYPPFYCGAMQRRNASRVWVMTVGGNLIGDKLHA
jgi:hypothetical protein